MKSLLIGISAYNEAANIAHLLDDIKEQVFSSEIELQKIIVVSDGSTDRTADIAQNKNIDQLNVINDGKRQGLAARLNQILSMARTDIVILLNADIRLIGPNCLSLLLEPIATGKADLSSCPIIAAPAKTTVQNALATSMEIKNEIFDAYEAGHNVYTCHGPARAFSKRLYSQIRFPHSVGEDAYSYLYAKKHGFRYAYVPSAQIVYKLPATLTDHQKQSHRFAQSKKQFIDEFGKEFVTDAYRLPNKLVAQTFCKYFIQSPISVLQYLIVMGLITITGWRRKPIPTAWNIASSSKE